MATWLVTIRDASGEQKAVGVRAQVRADAEAWARRWGPDVGQASVVSSRVMTPDEERQYGGVIDADAPGEGP